MHNNIPQENKIKIAVLQEQMCELRSDIKEIKDNHLVHIEERLRKIEHKLSVWSGGIIVATAVINLLFHYFNGL